MKEELEKVFDENPDLGYQGFGTMARNRPGFLPVHHEMFEKCVEWLNQHEKTKTVGPHSLHSYTLKHLVENSMGGYISSGIMIAATIHCNFPIKRIRGEYGAYIGISRKKLTRLGV